MKKLSILLFFLFAIAELANACSCMPLGPLKIKDYNEQSAIFIGKVKSLKLIKNADEHEQYELTFEVAMAFKGVAAKKEVKVYTNTSSAACGLTVSKNQSWLLYANFYKGVLQTSICTRSQLMSYAKSDELQLLNSFAAGKGTLWTSKGAKQGEGKLLNQKPVGYWKYYYPNGALAEEGNYINGQMDGKWVKYIDIDHIEDWLKNNELIAKNAKVNKADFRNKLTSISNYKLGKNNGEYISFDPLTSKVSRIINYNNDLEDGLSLTYYPSGLIEREENFKNGELHGYNRAYYSNGQLMYQGEYKNGKAGIFKAYDEQGKFLGDSNEQPYYDMEAKKLRLTAN